MTGCRTKRAWWHALERREQRIRLPRPLGYSEVKEQGGPYRWGNPAEHYVVLKTSVQSGCFILSKGVLY